MTNEARGSKKSFLGCSLHFFKGNVFKVQLVPQGPIIILQSDTQKRLVIRSNMQAGVLLLMLKT